MEISEYKSGVANYLICESVICGLFCLPCLLLMKSKPAIPPSNSQNNYESPPIKECIRILFKNKSFIILLINFSLIMSFFNLYGTISNTLLSMYHLSDQQISIIVGVANIIGIVGTLIVSYIVDLYKNYKLIFIILNLFGIVSHGISSLGIELYEEYAFTILLICQILVYCSILPIYTCSMDFVCEITYPVGETISGGIIMSCNQIFGIIIVIIF